MKYQMARQGWNHAPQCMMTPDEVKELVPIINIDNVSVHNGFEIALKYLYVIISYNI